MDPNVSQEVIRLTPGGDVIILGRPIDLTTEERLAVALLTRRMNPAANPEET